MRDQTGATSPAGLALTGDAVGDPRNKADLKDVGLNRREHMGRNKFALIRSVQLELWFPELSILETFLSVTFTSNEGKAGSTANKLKCASRTDQLGPVHPACYQNQCTSWFKVVSAEQNSNCTQIVNPEVSLL